MNVNNTTALTRELKPPEAPFLPTDDPQILWLKYQILIYFEGLKTRSIQKFRETKNVNIITNMKRA